MHYARRYVDINLTTLERYAKKVDREQSRLLARLARKEKQLKRRLRRKDSLAYEKTQSQPVSFDSISRLRKEGWQSSRQTLSFAPALTIDSIDLISSLADTNSNLEGVSRELYRHKELSNLKKRLDYQKYIDFLMEECNRNLRRGISKEHLSTSGYSEIQKKIYYAKSRMKVYKQISEEPSKSEEDALEFLQGMPHFDESFTSKQVLAEANRTGGSDGLQTTENLSNQFTAKYGANLPDMQSSLKSSIAGLKQDVREKADEYENTVKSIESVGKELKGFKVRRFVTNGGVRFKAIL